MKSASILFTAAFLATLALVSAPVAVAAASTSNSDSISLASIEAKLDTVVSKIEQLQFKLHHQQAERDNSTPLSSVSASSSLLSAEDPTLASWTRMTHTWGKPFSTPNQTAWFTVPHQNVASLDAGWQLDSSKACSEGTAVGNRYRRVTGDENSNSLWYLYGSNGEMAGLQSVVTINPGDANIAPNGPYKQDVGTNGETVWSITAYFRDPTANTICDATTPTTGRVGDGLWFAYTGDAATAESVPLSVEAGQSEVAVSTAGQRSFTVGNCMSTMGVHWWRVKSSDQAGHIDPYFLLYHPSTNQLVGFGFLELLGVATSMQEENYWESVPAIAAPLFMKLGQLPADVLKGTVDGRKFVLQSQHYYFVENPQKDINCPLVPRMHNKSFF